MTSIHATSILTPTETNRLRSATGYAGGSIAYTYWRNAALKTVTTNGSTEQYNYTDTRRHLLASISGGASYSLTRDSAGQWCSRGNRTFTWHGDGKLASIYQPGRPTNTTVSYAYDEDGKRWRTDRNNVTTLHLGDLVERRSGVLTEYVPFEGGVLELRASGPHKLHVKDAMSVAAVFTDEGNIDHLTTYKPYGKKVLLSGITDEPFDFNAKRREAGLGVLDYGARHYDPEIRQWMSVDPLRMAGIGE